MNKILRCLFIALLVPAFILLPGGGAAQPQRFSGYFFNTFDTVISLIGYAQDQATFDKAFEQTKERFAQLHQLFDKYNAYEGVNNVFVVNRDAAKAPVKVAPELMELLLMCRELQKKFPGTTNIAMGSVLSIWHDYREAAEFSPESAAVPSLEELQAAAGHMSMDDVILDEENGTVFFRDPSLSLDVGAVAKGYATELAARMLLQSDMPSFILNAGGNVRAGHQPLDGRLAWGVGIQDPFSPAFSDAPPVETLFLRDLSVVTSGINERYYQVEGERYHHLIDPKTLFPARQFASVTIVAEDSGLADFLSTALFVSTYEQGLDILKEFPGVQALWIDHDGTMRMTDGLVPLAKSMGAVAR